MIGSLPRLTLVPLLVAATVLGADAPKGLSVESPFAPAGQGAAAAGAPANENIEFSGVTTIGKRTDLIFYDKTAKKSHWLAKGETKAGITVLNYDAQRDQVVVKVNGVEKVLTLRKVGGANAAGRTVTPAPAGFNTPPAVVSGADAAAAAGAAPVATVIGPPDAPVAAVPPPAPSGPVTPETQARQETEARMLVSDLLEIGMAQRRAYEEAQRKAAESGAAGAAAPISGEAPAQPPITH